MALKLEELNPVLHHLGSVCKRGHQWKDTGQSPRFNHNNLCILCKRESHNKRKNDADYVSKRREQNEAAKKRYAAKNPRVYSIAQMKYRKKRKAADPYFALVERLRCRIRRAFNVFTKTGKIRTSREYGIDYGAIIEHLGECPNDGKVYHVDHIKPLSAFDLTDAEQVKLAFAPENHQWLEAVANIKKGGVKKVSAKELPNLQWQD